MNDRKPDAFRPAGETPETPGKGPSLAVGAGRPDSALPPELAGLFIGPHGIRAAWRLLLFFGFAWIFGFILVSLAGLLGLKVSPGLNPFRMLGGRSLGFLALLFAAWLMARMEKRSLAEYALPARGAFGARFWQGVVWGFVGLSSLMLVMRLAHGFYFGRLALAAPSLISYAALWAPAFLAVGCFEEFLFRGYALYTLSTGVGFWPAALSLSLLYGAVHFENPGENWLGALSACLMGIFLCLTVQRTGSLWFAIGLHAMWDYAESFIYSVPDSGQMFEGHMLGSSSNGPSWLTGGSVGPEGSLLAFAVIAVMLIVFDRLHREVRFAPRGQPSGGTQAIDEDARQNKMGAT